ncbi:2-succinyl-5-enolpyruvyl-6-hydroxy-3-cyclohexene-1-carboxylate synthase [Citrobacter koseri]|nr:2-succinyl-5-enolpyruvyl-6-hydroxy-3-cyclohexene-1-carboxylate synthase [Citrobacter koseri]
MSVSAFNRRWAAVILEALTRHGVRHVCIAPGSRSTPLTLAAAENSAFIHHTHFDERGLGHLALGLAKVSKQARCRYCYFRYGGGKSLSGAD